MLMGHHYKECYHHWGSTVLSSLRVNCVYITGGQLCYHHWGSTVLSSLRVNCVYITGGQLCLHHWGSTVLSSLVVNCIIITGGQLYLGQLYFYLAPRQRPGTGDIATDGQGGPSVYLSICLSVMFSFRTVTRKRMAVFSQNFVGTCTMSWGCAV